MEFPEFAELVPDLIRQKMKNATTPAPLADGEVHQETPNWVFHVGPVLALASLFPKTNELRLTLGVATNLAYSEELNLYVNGLNRQLVFGRAYLVDTVESRAAILMQEIVFGDGVSWDYVPSVQNLLRIMLTLCGQGEHLAQETLGRFEGRPFNNGEIVVMAVNC